MGNFPFAVASVACAACAALTAAAQPAMPHGPALSEAAASSSGNASFQAQMMEAMRRMDQGMAIAHSGNADRDFAAMMIPHHQGAIDMARAELQFGHDLVLRRLAQAIIVEQQQEIEVMHRQLDRLPAAP
jgi:uncharacterized protein (DUF305 family)